jgi:hypothetical protein
MNPRVFLFLILCVTFCAAQDSQKQTNYSFDASVFYGSIILHNADISHLITKHPEGLILGYNRKTYGSEDWQQGYNYPDLGASFIFHRSNNPTLGDNLGLYAHFNFYFLKRNVQLRMGTGLSYATNPYDRVENFRNNAYGTRILSSTFLMLNYQKENLFEGLGVKAGLSLIHFSNANVKAPNTSTNALALNAGLTYTLKEEHDYIRREKTRIVEPFKYNLVFRTGINESDVIGLGQFPFYIGSGYVDKRVGRKSALQLGADVFFSNFLKGLIQFQSVSFPENNVAPDTDFKRVGLFVGHELFINKLSLVTQLGYYVYYPFDFEGRVYNRVGLKHYFGQKWFGTITLKSHAAAAEAVEFGIGVRL